MIAEIKDGYFRFDHRFIKALEEQQEDVLQIYAKAHKLRVEQIIFFQYVETRNAT